MQPRYILPFPPTRIKTLAHPYHKYHYIVVKPSLKSLRIESVVGNIIYCIPTKKKFYASCLQKPDGDAFFFNMWTYVAIYM